jgi:cytochrome c oxidase subunit 3
LDSEAVVATELRHHFRDMEQQRETSSFGMWVFLITEIMFFGGMFAAYLIYRLSYYQSWVDGSNRMDIKLGAINTAVLIFSSLTMAMAVHSAQLGRRKLIILFLIATLALGCVFLGIKAVEYHDHWLNHEVPGQYFSGVDEHGVDKGWRDVPHTSLYFALYFAMTGMHALHMIIGAGLLIWLIVAAQRGKFSTKYFSPVENVGLYWHFVDIVWIYLFPLLYLISKKHSG